MGSTSWRRVLAKTMDQELRATPSRMVAPAQSDRLLLNPVYKITSNAPKATTRANTAWRGSRRWLISGIRSAIIRGEAEYVIAAIDEVTYCSAQKSRP